MYAIMPIPNPEPTGKFIKKVKALYAHNLWEHQN